MVTLWLTRWRSPLPAVWLRDAIAAFSASERVRLQRLRRPLRREQFIVGHVLLRQALTAAAAPDIQIEVDDAGRPRHAYLGLSLSHSGTVAVAAVGVGPLGVDVERERSLRDPAGVLALLGEPVPAPATTTASLNALALRRWTVFEARHKAGPAAAGTPVWLGRSGDQLLALAGPVEPPSTYVFDMLLGTYNSCHIDWTVERTP